MNLRGKRVLVTGADGFIGSHLVEMLQEHSAHVRGLALYNSLNSWGWLEENLKLTEVEVVTGDIRDPHFCYQLTRDIDIIFHLAAIIPIPYSYRSPDSYLETNIKGTLNICQAARANGIERFIQTSTSEVYGTAQYVPIDERHPLNPQSPYSATKIGADAIALSFYYSFELPVIIARPFNTYGPRQSARAVIPTVISQLAAGHREVSLGNLAATRDFTYVTDLCRGFLAIAGLDHSFGEVFHIGSNYEITIGSLFELIARTMGISATVVQEPERIRPVASEVRRLWCDNGKLERLCGFRPKYSLEEGIRRTVEWFRDPRNLSRYKELIYNV